jgi:hypothetical protein
MAVDDRPRARAAEGSVVGVCSRCSLVVKIGIIAGPDVDDGGADAGAAAHFMAMASDGLLPPWAARSIRASARRTDDRSTGVVVALAAGSRRSRARHTRQHRHAVRASSSSRSACMVLRRTQPSLPRPVPDAVGAGGADRVGEVSFSCVSLPIATWERLAIWMAIGIAI